jgi:uncharacterized protein (DUF488 family)
MAIYTVGHSNLNQEQFLELIKGLDVLMDVRSHPGSNKWPQFNKEQLERYVPVTDTLYDWEPGLGGWDVRHMPLASKFLSYGVDVAAYTRGAFPKQRIAKKLVAAELWEGRPSWTNQGLLDYSWFMTLPEFLVAADRLIEMAQINDVGIMCCEVLWWKCHRSMIADYMAFRNIDCIHLQPKPTSHLSALGDRLQRYHPEIIKVWEQHKEKSNGI